YYILAEYLSKGKTLGKLVTGTRAVTLTGETPTLNQIIGRSFARVIPFEPFSYLGDSPNGWHDQLSETIVIDEAKSNASQTNDEIV
ncbi:MAG: RDD family protein, partial [Saprospiraceae bacterium]